MLLDAGSIWFVPCRCHGVPPMGQVVGGFVLPTEKPEVKKSVVQLRHLKPLDSFCIVWMAGLSGLY